jgi:hypothetical protein
VGAAQIDEALADQKLYIELTIDAASPLAGGFWGGETLTLTGNGFSEVPMENDIRVGGSLCNVLTASHTQVQCIVPVTACVDLDNTLHGGAFVPPFEVVGGNGTGCADCASLLVQEGVCPDGGDLTDNATAAAVADLRCQVEQPSDASRLRVLRRVRRDHRRHVHCRRLKLRGWHRSCVQDHLRLRRHL